MSTEEKPQKISIGFHGGQLLALVVKPDDLKKLRDALGHSGWHELQTVNSSVALDLTRIDYLLVDSDEHRVGF